MYEEDDIDAEGGLEGKTQYNEDTVIDTGLDFEVPMPEVNDNNVNASVLLRIGNSYYRGKFIGRKIDTDGNAIGSTNDNPIHLLDCGENILHKGLLDSCHFAKIRTFSVCAILMFEFALAVVPSRMISGPG